MTKTLRVNNLIDAGKFEIDLRRYDLNVVLLAGSDVDDCRAGKEDVSHSLLCRTRLTRKREVGMSVGHTHMPSKVNA